MNFYKQFQEEIKKNPMPRTRYMDHPRQRGQSITVRMSVEEREKFEKLYKESTIPSKQAYLLAAVLKTPILTEYGEEQFQELLHELQGMAKQVNGIAHNLNQLTRYAHEQRHMASLSELNSATAELLDVIEELNDSLRDELTRYPHPAKPKHKKEG